MRSVTINYFPNSVIFILAVNLLCERKVHSVTISCLKVPEIVRNGSEAVILDCLYNLSPQELLKNSGLVVKWFFNRSPSPVYQWIHNQRPQVAGILKGRVNLGYRATDEHSSMYRALYITKPTIELSGEYKCVVSTLHEEDFSKKNMIVFAPERRMDFFHSRQDMDKINVSCRVEGVYPKPMLFLYKDPDRADNIPEEEVTINIYESRSGSFDVTTSAIFDETYLESPTVFDCELRVPGVSYNKRKTLLYFPGAMESLSSVSGTAVYVPLQVIYVLLISMCCFSTFYSRWS